ncbi:hypothetical protein D3C83_02560 [compost metagenome]
MVFRRREQAAVPNDEDVARRSLGEIPVTEQHDFGRAGISRRLPQQAVAQQGYRLDVALEPAEIGRGNAGHAVFDLLLRGSRQGARHHEHGGLRFPGEGMIALRDAARDLQVDRLVRGRVAADEFVNQPRPFRIGHRIVEPYGIKAVLEPREVLRQPERATRVGRDHFVDAVTEDEAAIEHRDLRFFERQEFAVEINRFVHPGPLEMAAERGVSSLY